MTLSFAESTRLAAAHDLAAAGATWGIPGPTFLLYFFVGATVLTAAAAIHRRILFAGPALFGGGEHLNPQQVAYLNGGDRLAIYAALGGLRAAGAVQMTNGKLTAGGSPPVGSTQLDQAIYNAAGQRIPPRALATHPWVVAALAQLRQGLEGAQLAATARQRRAARFVPLLMAGLLGLGLARFVAGLANGKPVLLLALLLIVYTFITLMLIFVVPRQTTAARQALARLRTKHRHLSPKRSPAYATYGAAGAAMGVALFGGMALWSLDPAFAAEAEIQRQSVSSDSGLSGDSGGGDGGCGGGCGGCGG